MTKKLTPNIRFKGFSDDWEQRKLQDIGNVKTGPFGSTLHAGDYVSRGIPIITTEHFKTGALPRGTEGLPQVSTEDYQRLHSYLLKKDDIVFSRVGSVDINALVTSIQDGWLFSGRVLRIRFNDPSDGPYMHYLLSTPNVKQHIVSRAVGQTMPSINTAILKETIVLMSNNSIEKQQVGNLLKHMDNLIASNQKKVDQLKQLKKLFLQKIFSQEWRFKGFTDPWEQRKFGDFLTESRIVGHSGLTKNKLTVKLWGKGVIKKNEIYKGSSSTKYYIRHSGQLIYGKLDFLHAAFGIIPEELEGYESTLDSPAFDTIRPVSTYYLLEYVLQRDFYLKQGMIANGSRKAKRINADVFLEMPLVIPSFNEQRHISDFLNLLSNLIASNQKKLDQLKQLKKWFLQNMFV